MINREYKSLKKVQSQLPGNDGYLISLAVRVKNEIQGLKMFWESIQKQTLFSRLEVTFLDSGSTDGTLAFLQALNCNIYTIDSADFSFGDSCNLIMSLTTCDHVCFFSGHVILESNSLLEEAYQFTKGKHASGYFRQVPNPYLGSSVYDDAFLKYRFPLLKSTSPVLIGAKNSFSNAASILSRYHWEKVSFKEVIFGEDEIWASELLKAGEPLYYFSRLSVMHSHNDSYAQTRKRVAMAAKVKYPAGVSFVKCSFIFSKVFIAIFINSGRLLESINYAYAHSKAYADIKGKA